MKKFLLSSTLFFAALPIFAQDVPNANSDAQNAAQTQQSGALPTSDSSAKAEIPSEQAMRANFQEGDTRARRFPHRMGSNPNGALPPPDRGVYRTNAPVPNAANAQQPDALKALVESQGGAGRPQTVAGEVRQNSDDMQGPFYFVDESPIQVIRILEDLTGKVILQNGNLPNAKINFATKSKMPRSEAIVAFESLLTLNGIAVIPMGEKYLKAVPSTAVVEQAPQFIMGNPSDLPVSLNFYTKLFELEYMDMNKISERLKPFLSSSKVASLDVFPRSNAVLVTDTLANLQRMQLLFEKLDKPAQIREDIAFIQLKNVSAEDMKTRLTNMQSDILKRYFESTTIDVDARTNQVIVLTQKGNMPYIKKLIDGLDIPADPLLKSQVVYIKHGDAKDVVQVLNSVISGQQQAAKNASASKNRQNSATRAATQAASIAAKTPAAAKAATANKAARDTDSGLQFSEYVTTTADEWSNGIVIYGTPSDISQVRALIEKLDIQLYQVRIDVIITEVTLADNQVSGLSTFGLAFGDQGGLGEWPNTAGQFSGTTSTYALSKNSNPAFSVTANQDGFNAAFNAAQESTNVRVLSSPSITTSHNKEASIRVGQKYPIITSSTSDLINTNTTKSSVSQENIGIELKVLPRIGENGIVQIQVNQKVETIIDYTTIDLNQQPIIGSREAESFISVQSGETIVLAGLQQVDVSDKDGKVWLLGDLPVLGWLFSPSSSNMTRRELVIFIRPTVIKSSKISEIIADKAIAESAFGEEIRDYFNDGRFYSRKVVKEKEKLFESNRFYNRIWQAPWSLIVPPEHKTVEAMLKDEVDARMKSDAAAGQNADGKSVREAELSENRQ